MPASTPTRILIVRVGAMGDILHALPAVTALRIALPHAHIGWAVDPHWRPLLASALVDQVHEIPTRNWKDTPFSLRTLQQILSLRASFRLARYDVAVDLQGSLRSAFLARLSGAPSVFGPAAPREAPARTFYTQRVALREPNVIDQAAELLHAATGLTLVPARPILPNDDLTPDIAALHGQFILLSPSAGWGAKEWPLALYHDLIQRLEAGGYHVVINGGQALKPSGPILTDDTRAHLLTSELAQLVSITRRAALVIGGDSGPVHLAAALGVPTLALFGPTDPARNGPDFPSARVIVLRNPASPTTYKRNPGPDPGLERITVEEVYKAALSLLATP